MAKRDYRFKYENTNGQKPKPKHLKKPNPSPPINSRRNPSAAVSESSPYDKEERKVLNRVEEIEVDIGQFNLRPEPEEDVKIYTPEKARSKQKLPAEKNKSKKLMIIAAVLVALGICFVGVGVYIGLNYL